MSTTKVLIYNDFIYDRPRISFMQLPIKKMQNVMDKVKKVTDDYNKCEKINVAIKITLNKN